jgi:hypothetical protein
MHHPNVSSFNQAVSMFIGNSASHWLNGNLFQRVKFLVRESGLVPGHVRNPKLKFYLPSAISVLLFLDNDLMISAIFQQTVM